MPACPKTCSHLFAGSPADSCSSHAHCLPTKLLYPASVLLFTLGFLSNFSSVPNNLILLMCRYLTTTHVLTPSVFFFSFLHSIDLSTLDQYCILLKLSSCYLITHQAFHTYIIFSLNCLQIGPMMPISFLFTNRLLLCNAVHPVYILLL